MHRIQPSPKYLESLCNLDKTQKGTKEYTEVLHGWTIQQVQMSSFTEISVSTGDCYLEFTETEQPQDLEMRRYSNRKLLKCVSKKLNTTIYYWEHQKEYGEIIYKNPEIPLVWAFP